LPSPPPLGVEVHKKNSLDFFKKNNTGRRARVVRARPGSGVNTRFVFEARTPETATSGLASRAAAVAAAAAAAAALAGSPRLARRGAGPGAAAATQQETERVNVCEAALFNSGEKRVAIISDAASVGISLHDSLTQPANVRRRRVSCYSLGVRDHFFS